MRRIVGAPRSRSGRDRLGREVGRPARATSSRPATCSASAPGVGEALGEQHVDDREQQQRVGPRADEVVLVGLARGARAPRVDDDDLAAARADGAQAAAHVGRGHQAAVGGQRVGAEDQQVVGAVEVGHRRPSAPLPNISAAAICLGIWSTVLALSRCCACRSALSSTRP